MNILETRHTRLRSLAVTDLGALADLYADPETMRFITGGVPRTREETAKRLDVMIEQEQRQGYGLWAVEHSADRKLIGRCGLIVCDVEGVRENELAYMIARDYSGRGLATEIAIGIRDHSFGALGLTRLISLIDPENTASVRVAEKAGLQFERDVCLFNHPIKIYSIER